jgi:hypothetical protein
MPTTWEYLNTVVAPALLAVGLEIHRVRCAEWESIPAHGKNWLSHNGNTVLFPAFTDESGTMSKLGGFCSKRWKQEVRDRFMSRRFGIGRSKQRVWIGFSLDETSRAIRMMAGDEYKNGLIWFPLIEGVPMRRQQAVNVVKKMGWPDPPRSRCWCCPNQGDDEWREIKRDHPALFEEAVKLENEVRLHDPNAWFHKSCTPLASVDFSQEASLFDNACSSGNCFV